MATANPVVSVRFIAAWLRKDDKGKTFVSISLAGGDLAEAYPEADYSVSYTLDLSLWETLMTQTRALLGQKVISFTKVKKGADLYWRVKSEGVLYLTIGQTGSPKIERGSKGQRDLVSLYGDVEGVELRQKRKPNGLNLKKR